MDESGGDSSPGILGRAVGEVLRIQERVQHGLVPEEEKAALAEHLYSLADSLDRKLVDVAWAAQDAKQIIKHLLVALDAYQEPRLKSTTTHVAKLVPAVAYQKRLLTQRSGAEAKWLLQSPWLRSKVSEKDGEQLARLHNGKTAAEVQCLLARALWERYRLRYSRAVAQQSGDAQLDTTHLRHEDVVKACDQHWELDPPSWPTTSGLPSWMQQDETGIPYLPSHSCRKIEACEIDPPLCESLDLYKSTATTLQALANQRLHQTGYLKVKVLGLPELPTIKITSACCEARKLEYQYPPPSSSATTPDAKHYVLLLRAFEAEKLDPDRSYPVAPFPTLVSPPDLQKWMEDVVAHPPQGVLDYLVVDPHAERDDANGGIGRSPSTSEDGDARWLQDILHPGHRLQSRGTLIGINTPLYFVSLAERTGSAMHQEDCDWGSMSLLVSGAPKIWLIARPVDRSGVERLVRKWQGGRSGRSSCSQSVRHAAVFVAPSTLQRKSIAFDVVKQEVGDLIQTFPGAYHQVINTGPNFAIAINCESDDAPDLPKDYQFCSKKRCADKAGLTKEDFYSTDDRLFESEAHTLRTSKVNAESPKSFNKRSLKRPYSTTSDDAEQSSATSRTRLSKRHHGVAHNDTGSAPGYTLRRSKRSRAK